MAVNDGRLISNIIIQALRGDDLTIFGNGKQTRSFCYVDDLIIGLKAMSSDIFSNPINLGNPNEIQIIEAVEKIKDLTNSKSKLFLSMKQSMIHNKEDQIFPRQKNT